MTEPNIRIQDPHAFPDTFVPRNNFGIVDPNDAHLNQLIDDRTYARIYQLDREPARGNFDLPHLQRIHHAIFQDVYPWAGQLRIVGLQKQGVNFCPSVEIVAAADRLFDHLEEENFLQGLSTEPFIQRIAVCHSAINYIHPFREGNGRANRVFLGQLAREAGYDLHWERLDPILYNRAARIHLTEEDLTPMKQIFAEVVERRFPFDEQERQDEAFRLRKLATDVKASARRSASSGNQILDDVPNGASTRLRYLTDRRTLLDQRMSAIRALEDDTIGQKMDPRTRAKLSGIAGPRATWETIRSNHRRIELGWERFTDAQAALDIMDAGEHHDVSIRQMAMAERIRDRAANLVNAGRASSGAAPSAILSSDRHASQTSTSFVPARMPPRMNYQVEERPQLSPYEAKDAPSLYGDPYLVEQPQVGSEDSRDAGI